MTTAPPNLHPFTRNSPQGGPLTAAQNSSCDHAFADANNYDPTHTAAHKGRPSSASASANTEGGSGGGGCPQDRTGMLGSALPPNLSQTFACSAVPTSQRMHPCEAAPCRHHLSRRRPSSTGTFVPTTVHLAAAHTGATKTVARYEQGNDSMSEEEI